MLCVIKVPEHLPPMDMLPEGCSYKRADLDGKFFEQMVNVRLSAGDGILLATPSGLIKYTVEGPGVSSQDSERTKLLQRRLLDCGFSTRVENLLLHGTYNGGPLRWRLETLGELVERSETDLLRKIDNFGQVALKEVRLILSRLGLALKPSTEHLVQPIDKLGLGERINNRLKADNITLVGHLTERTEKQVRSGCNLQRNEIRKVKESLTVRGLGFRSE